MRDAIAAFSGCSRKDGQFEQLLSEGKLRVSKYHIQRVGTNATFRDALVEARGAPGAGAELNKSGSSDI